MHDFQENFEYLRYPLYQKLSRFSSLNKKRQKLLDIWIRTRKTMLTQRNDLFIYKNSPF